MCFFDQLYIYFGEISIQVFLSIFESMFIFCCWVVRLLWIFWILIPCQVENGHGYMGKERVGQNGTVAYIYGEGNGTPLQCSCLENPMDWGGWWAAVHGVVKSRAWLSNFTFTFHSHALEKKMATHSSVLAWRIPGMGEPSGLPSMRSHRVGHDWSDLAAAYIYIYTYTHTHTTMCEVDS